MRIIFSLFVFLAGSTPVFAAGIDRAGAQTLKVAVEDAIRFQVEVAKASGEGLTLSGEVDVQPMGTFYQVKIPGVSISAQGGGRFDIGTVIVNAIPGAGQEYLISMALSPQMTAYDTHNQPQFRIAAGQQKFSGVWHPDLNILTSVDARYDNVTFYFGQKLSFAVGLDTVTSRMHLTRNADNTWSGPVLFDIKGLKSAPEEKLRVQIAAMTVEAVYDGINPAVSKEMQKGFNDLAMQKDSPPTPEQARAFVENVLKNSPPLFRGIHTKMGLVGLDAGAAPARVKLDKLSTTYEIKGLGQDRGSTVSKAVMSGLSVAGINGIPQEVLDLIPVAAGSEIHLDNVPMKALSDSFFSMIAETAALSFSMAPTSDTLQRQAAQEKAQGMVDTAVMSMPDLLAAAGTTLTISNTFTKTAAISSSTSGKLVADALAVFKVRGEMTLTITGLDEQIESLSAMAKSDPAKKELARVAQGLGFIQIMGERSKTPDGKSLRIYKFELTPEGGMLLNGKNFGMMAGMMPSPAALAPAGTR